MKKVPIILGIVLLGLTMLLGGVLVLNNYTGSPQITAQVLGDGSMDNPWQLSSRTCLNTTLRNNSNRGHHFILTRDIDMRDGQATAALWTPITTFGAGSLLNGQGFTIFHLRTNIATNSGLFGTVSSATVQNINFSDVAIQFSTQQAGTVAGTSAGNSNFENIRIESGTVMSGSAGTGHSTGGLIGWISGGNATFTNVFNRANVSSAHSVGGIVGRAAAGTASVTIYRAGNLGRISAGTGTANTARVGGIMGDTTGTANVTIDWSFNRGEIISNQGMSAGILGAVRGGMVRISNTINDATFGTQTAGHRGLIVAVESGVAVLNNVWSNPTTPARNLANITISAPNSGINADIRTQGRLDIINRNGTRPGQITVDVFILWDNQVDGRQIIIYSLADTVTYYFYPGLGAGARLFVYQPNDRPIYAPSTDLPTRVGYAFVGWTERGCDGTVFPHSELIPPLAFPRADRIFDAKFELGYFLVVIDIPRTLSLATMPIEMPHGNRVQMVGVGNRPQMTLYAPHFGINNLWLIQGHGLYGDTDFDTQTVNLDPLVDEEFIIDHALPATAQDIATDPLIIGRFMVRIVTSSNFYSITFQSPNGTLHVEFSDGAELAISQPSRQIRLLGGRYISRIRATANAHFSITTITIGTTTHTLNNGEFTPAPNTVVLGLTLGTIAGNFVANEYDVVFLGYVRGSGEQPAESALVDYTPMQVALTSIGIVANITAEALIAQTTHRFAGWRIRNRQPNADGSYAYTFLSADYDLNVTRPVSVLLAQHLFQDEYDKEKIVVVAEFVPTHNVTIRVATASAGRGNLSVTVVDGLNPMLPTSWTGPTMRVVAGTTISIFADAGNMYEFSGATVNSGELTPTGAMFNVTGTRTVDVSFGHRAIAVSLNTINDGNSVMERSTVGAIRVGGTLIMPEPIERPGHRFLNFTVYDGTGNVPLVIDREEGIQITQGMMNRAENRNEQGQFVVRANYVRIFTLNVALSTLSIGMGTYTVQVRDDGTFGESTTQRTFDYGTVLRITASPNNFHQLPTNPFGLLLPGVIGANPNELIVTGGALPVTVTLHFVAQRFTLGTELNAGAGEITPDRVIDADGNIVGLVVNSQITLSATPPSGREVRSWRINGILVDADMENVEIHEGWIIFTLSSTWINQNTTPQGTMTLRVELNYALTLGVLLAILLPSILIPLTAGGFAFYTIRSNKKYKATKAKLLGETRFKVTMQTGSFVKELKEGGNVGQVRKEDIKKAMKDKKKKK